jgi:hypothetical protein
MRYERAGFSASWVETVIAKALERGSATIFDPFAGAGTTLLAAEKMGVECLGVEAHPFVARIASAKLLYRTDPALYLEHIRKVKIRAENLSGCVDNYPALIRSCFSDRSLEGLNRLWQAWKQLADDSPQSELVWLTIIAILCHVSCVGTAPWQYILPNQTKKSVLSPMSAFELMVQTQVQDMRIAGKTAANTAKSVRSDARTCLGVPDDFADLIITSPPYTNNYDYADATRLEMCFAGKISGKTGSITSLCAKAVCELGDDLDLTIACINSS